MAATFPEEKKSIVRERKYVDELVNDVKRHLCSSSNNNTVAAFGEKGE